MRCDAAIEQAVIKLEHEKLSLSREAKLNVEGGQGLACFTAEHVKQANEEKLNTCDTEKQHLHVILHDNLRNMKKAVDDMEVPSVGCVSHTSAACTQGSAVIVQRQTHLLTQLGGRPMLQ